MKRKRLEKIMEYLPSCGILADIGTDHGYIPVLAVERGKAEKAVAADISGDSLAKAAEEIKKRGLQEQIEARQGSGLGVLKRDEADVVVIAGMGGQLIGEILEEDYDRVFEEKRPLLILQPAQSPEKLRRWLYGNGFSVQDEDLVKEQGIIYHLILAEKKENGPERDSGGTGAPERERESGTETAGAAGAALRTAGETGPPDWPETEKEGVSFSLLTEFGEWNLRKNTPLLRELIRHKIKGCENLIAELEGKEGEKARARLREVTEKKNGYLRLENRKEQA